MDPSSDLGLLAHAQQGDFSAFQTLSAPHMVGLFRFCRAMLDDANLAEEIALVAHERAWLAIGQCRGSFKPWLFTIARRLCLDELRSPHRRQTVSLESVPEPLVETFEEEVIHRQMVEHALSRLPTETSDLVRLHHYGGLDWRETAEVLNITHTAARQRYVRALRMLYEMLQP